MAVWWMTIHAFSGIALQYLVLLPPIENKAYCRSPDLLDRFPKQIKGVRKNVTVI
jgi:hypothetical protein